MRPSGRAPDEMRFVKFTRKFTKGPDEEEETTERDTAVELLVEALNAPVISIANLSDLVQYLEASGSEQAETTLSNMRDYQALYWQA